MGLNAPLNRKLRMGLVGGGQGAFIGRVHSIAAVLDQPRRPRRRRPVVRPRQGQGLRPRLRHHAGAGLRLLQGDGRGREEAARRRAHRFRLRRHAQPHALRDRQGLRRGRLQRHVRQADDLRPGPGRGAGEGRAEDRRRLRASRTTTPAIRWCARPATWSRPANWARSTPSAPSTSRAGCARGWSSGSWQKQASWRTDPKRSGAAGCFGDIGTHAYNLGRFITGLLARPGVLPAQDLRAGPASWTITARPSSAIRTAPWAPSPRRRSRTAARTTCGSRSTAPRRRWNGTRRSRTRCSCRVNGQPHQHLHARPERPAT